MMVSHKNLQTSRGLFSGDMLVSGKVVAFNQKFNLNSPLWPVTCPNFLDHDWSTNQSPPNVPTPEIAGLIKGYS